MKKIQLLALGSILLIVCIISADASIFYDLVNLGGNNWEYNYTVENDTLASPIKEFRVFFDSNLYENLGVTSNLPSWDEYIKQPNNGSFGTYTASNIIGIASNKSQSGYSVGFRWLGKGTPNSQPYQIIQSNSNTESDQTVLAFSFQTIDSDPIILLEEGYTQAFSSENKDVVVPEPMTMIMLGSGLLGLAGFRKKKLVN